MNRMVLSAQLLERGVVRYTPAGLPVIDCRLQHESSVTEDGQPRRISLEIKALAIGAIARPMSALVLGQTALYGGFLASARNGRGLLMREGYEADIAPDGDALVRLPFTPSGVNFETFIELLQLRSGVIGYRDGLVRMVDSYLEVNAMIRLAAQVESSGDDEVTAAPVGKLTPDQWRAYPALGEGITMVQVSLEVQADGTPLGHIMFLRSALA